jgi:CheY-like chemotaxis protein
VAEFLAGIRVLVVDDDDDTRVIMHEVLDHLGAHVVTVASAREALSHAPAVDIVITDVAMPGEDGVWLLERINELPRPVPVVAMSGYAEWQVPRFAGAPFARTLLKPVEGSRLAGAIHELVRAKRDHA